MAKTSSSLARFSVERPVTITMIVIGVLVMGWISLSRLPLEFLPTFSSSSISVSVSYPSAAPEEIERRIVRPLEDSLGTINGIETLSATAAADSGSVSITFVDGVDMDIAAVEVRDRVDRVRSLLPDDVDRIRIRRFQSTDIPIISINVGGSQSLEQMYAFVDEVMVRRLERLEGVAQVTPRGVEVPNVHVDLVPSRVRAHGVSVSDLVSRVREENRNLTLGEVRSGSRKLLVRSIGEFASLDEISRMPLASGVKLADVAQVTYGFPRKDTYQFLNGAGAVVVRINKVSTSNLLEVAARVKDELEVISQLPRAEGLEMRVYHDASEDVRLGLAQLRNAGLFGGLLAILSVFFFLRRVRTTLLVAVAIPISVITTFVLMYLLRQIGWSDITLNVVSLAGLMLALGMLVDNSIVVIESIFRHRNELGANAAKAALDGTSEVALPIIASTMTTLCVFVPIIFFGGDGWMQTYFKNIATTVSIVMTSSLLVALTVVPMAATFFLRGQAPRSPGLVSGMTGAYGALLRFVLRFRAPFVVVIVLLLVGSIRLFSTIERSFSNRTEEREVAISVETPRQFSLEDKERLFGELYELVDSRRAELDIADISHSYDRGSGATSRGWSRSNIIQLYLVEESQGSLTTAEVRDRVRDLLPVRAGVELKIGQASHRGGGGGIEIELSGANSSVLQMLSDRLAKQLRAVPMLKDVDTSLASGDEELLVQVDPERALQAGLSSQAVALTVSGTLSSRAVSQFKTADREVDLILQNRQEDRETLEQLRQTPVGVAGVSVPLDTLATFSTASGPRQIERENHLAKMKVTANTNNPRETFVAMGMLGDIMNGFALPPGYSWSFGRWNRYQQEEQSVGNFALWFALLLIYMLMASLFESFAQPFVILFSVPFALLGVAVVMKLANQPMEAMTMIGVIILLGVVVNNAIVLVDHVNQLRKEGLARTEAIVLGGQHRLRPILMTAVTTIVGLSPMVAPILFPETFGPVEGRAGTWAPIGLVILGGLTTSTFLTLVILPIIYTIVDDVAKFMARVSRTA